jgi:hypothetical protein
MRNEKNIDANSIIVQLSPRRFAVVPLSSSRIGSVRLKADGQAECVWVNQSEPTIIFSEYGAAKKWITLHAVDATDWTEKEARFVGYVRENASSGKTLKVPDTILWDATIVPNNRRDACRKLEEKNA